MTKQLVDVRLVCVLCLLAGPAVSTRGQDLDREPPAPALPYSQSDADPAVGEKLTERIRDSIVVIQQLNRDGQLRGMGAGFVVSSDGLIATNLHVVGSALPLRVETREGRELEVVAIHATEPGSDLAVIRVKANDLPAVELGDSDTLRQGAAVMAFGHPKGREHSVVSGLLSAREEIDDLVAPDDMQNLSMLRLSIPMERGNSGGPLIDMQGRVHGILTLKSLREKDLGFAVPINALRPLLQKPNPIPMERWLQIGSLDRSVWEPMFGARWRQRAEYIYVSESGRGFGGRSLCLLHAIPPSMPFELNVDVRMDDDSGTAAGLVFHADGKDKHYGFYPSNGRLRLSRFDGPTVYQWQVLHEMASPHYQEGEWNSLRVIVSAGGIRCYINDALVIESKDTGLTGGRAGLAKFRQTVGEFRNFRVQPYVPASDKSQELIAGFVDKSDWTADSAARQLLADMGVSRNLLRQEAQQLEEKARRLRELSSRLNQLRTRSELVAELGKEESEIHLLRAALLLARLSKPTLDIEVYVRQVERMAQQIRDDLPPDANEQARLQALNHYLFAENGFHGSRRAFARAAGSFMNEVLFERSGLPITLSVLYMQLAEAIDVNVVGVGLPGHYVVRFEPSDKSGKSQLIDVYDRGRLMKDAEAVQQVERITERKFDKEYLKSQTKQAIIERMIRNLIGLAQDQQSRDRLMQWTDTLLAVNPDAHEFRAQRYELNFRSGEIDAAIRDVDWFLKHQPPGYDLKRLQEMRMFLESQR